MTIPGSRKAIPLGENAAAAQVKLTGEEVARIDAALAALPLSDVFGGSPVKRAEEGGAAAGHKRLKRRCAYCLVKVF